MIGNVVAFLLDPANWTGGDGIAYRAFEHLVYSFLALLAAAALGIPLGLYIGHTGRGRFLVAGLANALRALPSLGLLLVLVLLFQRQLTGPMAIFLPCLVVLVILAVPPILTNAYAGVESVDPAARDAAYGMGMTGSQVLGKVELPCALPLILSGIRSSMLQVVSTTTIAAYVSFGGLGEFVFDGQANNDYAEMLAGALLVGALAVLVELVLAGVQRRVVPRGLTGRYARGTRADPAADARRTPGDSGEPGDADRQVAGEELETAR